MKTKMVIGDRFKYDVSTVYDMTQSVIINNRIADLILLTGMSKEDGETLKRFVAEEMKSLRRGRKYGVDVSEYDVIEKLKRWETEAQQTGEIKGIYENGVFVYGGCSYSEEIEMRLDKMGNKLGKPVVTSETYKPKEFGFPAISDCLIQPADFFDKMKYIEVKVEVPFKKKAKIKYITEATYKRAKKILSEYNNAQPHHWTRHKVSDTIRVNRQRLYNTIRKVVGGLYPDSVLNYNTVIHELELLECKSLVIPAKFIVDIYECMGVTK